LEDFRPSVKAAFSVGVGRLGNVDLDGAVGGARRWEPPSGRHGRGADAGPGAASADPGAAAHARRTPPVARHVHRLEQEINRKYFGILL